MREESGNEGENAKEWQQEESEMKMRAGERWRRCK